MAVGFAVMVVYTGSFWRLCLLGLASLEAFGETDAKSLPRSIWWGNNPYSEHASHVYRVVARSIHFMIIIVDQ